MGAEGLRSTVVFLQIEVLVCQIKELNDRHLILIFRDADADRKVPVFPLSGFRHISLDPERLRYIAPQNGGVGLLSVL